jgi:hypothetical protein
MATNPLSSPTDLVDINLSLRPVSETPLETEREDDMGDENDMDDDKDQDELDQELIAKALKQFANCEESMSVVRKDADDDDNFKAGNQWPEQYRNERTLDGRPSLVVNKLPSFCNRVTNELRQNRPEIKVKPVDDSTDPETAEIINGILQHIAYNSDAETAYDTAADHAISHGFGYFRILTDYCYDDSFDQEIKIDRIENSYTVYFPLHLCHKSDFSDAPYCFVVKDMSKEDFEETYPNQNVANWNVSSIGMTSWITEQTVRIVEYFVIETTKKNICKLADGTTVDEDKVPQGAKIVKTRETEVRQCKWYLLTAGAILDRKDFPSKYIPIIPVLAKEEIVEGKKQFISLIRFAKDPQRMLNYWKSSECEFIALAPRAPYIMAKGQVEGFELIWQTANRKPHAFLPYNPVTDAAGATLPAPRRTDPAQIPTGYVNASREAADDIKATTGIYDASLGAAGNETSGRAILSRQRQSDTSNFHFYDNLARALKHAGRIIVDMIPTIYDTARVIRIVGEDKQDKAIKINQRYSDEKGKSKFYDLTVGRYDVMVDTGPGYASRREEAVDGLMRFVQAFPQAGAVAGDLIVKNLEFQGASELAARLKRGVNPKLLEDENDPKNAGPSKAEMVAVVSDLQKVQQMNVELMSKLHEAQTELKSKDKDRQVQIDQSLLNAETELEKIRLTKGLTDAAYATPALVEQIIDMKNILSRLVPVANSPEQGAQNIPQLRQAPTPDIAPKSMEQALPVA